jgi:hypothetical protein
MKTKQELELTESELVDLYNSEVANTSSKKVYRAELAYPDNDIEDAIDLVNVIDEHDRIMAAPNEFFVGSLYDEDTFVIKDADYVDDNGVGHAPFVFNVQFHSKD